MLCIKCGGAAQIGRFCSRCYLALHPLVPADRLKGLKLKVCEQCGKHMHRGHWTENIDRTVAELARAKAVHPVSVKAHCSEEKGVLACQLSVSKGNLFQQVPIEVRLEKVKCNVCGLRKEYFEAILQLRCSREAENYAIADIKESRMLTKAEPVKGAGKKFDLYLKSTDYAMGLAKRLKKRFPGTIKISRKLHGRDRATSKDLYRTTVLFRE